MLPAPRGIYPGTRPNDPDPWVSPDLDDLYVHPCANFDMYDAAAWDLGLDPDAKVRLQAVLAGAAAFHRDLFDWHLTLPFDYLDRMLIIAGVGYKTLFRLAYKKGFFGLWEHADKQRAQREALGLAADARKLGHAVEVWDRAAGKRLL